MVHFCNSKQIVKFRNFYLWPQKCSSYKFYTVLCIRSVHILTWFRSDTRVLFQSSVRLYFLRICWCVCVWFLSLGAILNPAEALWLSAECLGKVSYFFRFSIYLAISLHTQVHTHIGRTTKYHWSPWLCPRIRTTRSGGQPWHDRTFSINLAVWFSKRPITLCYSQYLPLLTPSSFDQATNKRAFVDWCSNRFYELSLIISQSIASRRWLFIMQSTDRHKCVTVNKNLHSALLCFSNTWIHSTLTLTRESMTRSNGHLLETSRPSPNSQLSLYWLPLFILCFALPFASSILVTSLITTVNSNIKYFFFTIIKHSLHAIFDIESIGACYLLLTCVTLVPFKGKRDATPVSLVW